MSEAAAIENTTAAEDAEVAAALGVGNPDVEEQDTEQDTEDQESTEVEFEDLPKTWQDEIRKLRRENAANRVKAKQVKAAVNEADSKSTDVEAAREAGREEARAEHGIELATEAVRAALTGVIPEDDLDEFVDELNIARFVTDEHKPDRDAIASLKARQTKLTGVRKTSKVNHGRQGGGATKKSNADQFADVLQGLLG